MSTTFSYQSARFWLLGALVFCMPLSLLPSVSLPLFNFPSFRIGLYQLLAAAFVIVCLPLLAQQFRRLALRPWFTASLVTLGFVLGLGVLLAIHQPRSLLYSTSLVSLLLLGFSGYVAYQELSKSQHRLLRSVLLWSGAIFGALAVVQLCVASVDTSALGTLCTGCASTVFGFPRINLFAAEPQFFANSLLPAFFAALVWSTSRLARWSLFLSSLALALTFSRGAVLALCIGCLAMATVTLAQKQFTVTAKLSKSILVIMAGFVVGFSLLVVSASYRYHTTPFIAHNTIVSMLDHISLGIVDIPQKTAPAPPAQPPITPTTPTQPFAPEGFVEESSNDRLDAAKLALDAWDSDVRTVLFGVGMGNLGAYVNRHIGPVPENLTVYIFYILVLAEIGLVGMVILLAPLVLCLVRGARNAQTSLGLFVLGLTSAFAVQFLFFGSYINVMYLYLVVGCFLAIDWRGAKAKNRI